MQQAPPSAVAQMGIGDGQGKPGGCPVSYSGIEESDWPGSMDFMTWFGRGRLLE